MGGSCRPERSAHTQAAPPPAFPPRCPSWGPGRGRPVSAMVSPPRPVPPSLARLLRAATLPTPGQDAVFAGSAQRDGAEAEGAATLGSLCGAVGVSPAACAHASSEHAEMAAPSLAGARLAPFRLGPEPAPRTPENGLLKIWLFLRQKVGQLQRRCTFRPPQGSRHVPGHREGWPPASRTPFAGVPGSGVFSPGPPAAGVLVGSSRGNLLG